MKPLGLGLIAVACLAPMIWLPGIAAGRDVVALFSQYLGMIALIVMATAHVIATRWPGVEAVFGPLDQSYRLHKWLGIGAMVAILLHDTIDADMRGIGTETLISETAETAGEISLYGLLVLVVITLATFIPYDLWKWTHRLIGIFFVLGAGHYLFILKPFENGDPLGLYMGSICAVGVVAYLYTSAPRHLRPSRTYQIASLRPEGTALSVEMMPTGPALRYRPGQFGFFSFIGANKPEPHPFTISSAPRVDGSLRVTVAPLGDLTRGLIGALAVGQTVRAEGPFGGFGRHKCGPQVWIAAGVGITPFAALAEALPEDADPITLIYAVRSEGDAAHLQHVRAIAQQKPNLRLELWQSAVSGRIGAGDVANLVGPELAQASVLFCGPTEMCRVIGEGLERHGVSSEHFHSEAFEIRTGLGLRRFAAWFWSKWG